MNIGGRINLNNGYGTKNCLFVSYEVKKNKNSVSYLP